MNRNGKRTALPRSLAVSGGLVIALLIGACGSDATTTASDAAGSSPVSTEAGQTYAVVSDAEVAAGFARVKPLVATAVEQIGAGDRTAAAAMMTGAYVDWFTFEGTVRKVDQSRYLDMEDALASVKAAAESGDRAKAAQGAADFSRLADSYLSAHPTGSADVAAKVTAAATGPATGVDLQLAEYSIVGPSELKAGTYEFTIDNLGILTHELVVFRTDLDPGDVALTAEGRIDEKGAGMTFIDEKEDIKAGETAKLRVDLPAGRYLIACNVTGHWAKKMYHVIEVR